MERSFEDMQDRVRRALCQYPIASLTILRGAVQLNHPVVHPATAALVASGEIIRLPPDPLTRQAERLFLARYREHLTPFLIGEAGRDHRQGYEEKRGRIVEAFHLYPILTRWALCVALNTDWVWIEKDLAWLLSQGVVAGYLPGDGDKRRVPKYYLAQYACQLAVFLGEGKKKEVMLQGA